MFYLFVIHSKIKQPSTSIESRNQMAAKVCLFDRDKFSLGCYGQKKIVKLLSNRFFHFPEYENTAYYAKHTK